MHLPSLSPRALTLLRRAGTVVALVALAALLRVVPWREVREALRHANGAALFAAAALNLATLVVRGSAWWWFLGPARRSAFAATLRGTFVGAAINNLVPWNLGDAARLALFSSGTGIPVGRATTAFAMERLTTGLSALALLTAAMPWIALPFTVAPAVRWLVAALLATVIVLVVRGRYSVSDLGVGLGLGAAGWIGQLAVFHVAGRALGIVLPLGSTIAIMAACNLGFIIRLTPGSVGVFQVVYAATAVALGVPRPLALAASLMLQAAQIVPVVLLGLAWMPQAWRKVGAG